MESSHVLLLFANNTILISSSGGAQTSWCETSRSSSRCMTDSVSIMTSSLLSPNFKHILVFGLNFCFLTLSLSSQFQITTMQLTQQYACSYSKSKVVEIVKEVIACDNVLSWFLYFSPSSPKQEVDRSCWPLKMCEPFSAWQMTKLQVVSAELPPSMLHPLLTPPLSWVSFPPVFFPQEKCFCLFTIIRVPQLKFPSEDTFAQLKLKLEGSTFNF